MQAFDKKTQVQLRIVMVVCVTCLMAAAASLIIGTIADDRTREILFSGGSFDNVGVLSGQAVATLKCEEGRTYLVIGSSLLGNAQANVSIESEGGRSAVLVPGTGKVRDMSVVGSFTVPATDTYTVTMTTTSVFGVHAYVVDESIRGWDEATGLLPAGFVFLFGALVLAIVWTVKRKRAMDLILPDWVLHRDAPGRGNPGS